MSTRRVGIVMNGVTGRMGRNQHLARSIAAIRSEGGLKADGVTIWPDPVLVGRDLGRLRELGATFGIERCSTDLDVCLADPKDEVYFDAQTTVRREEAVAAAIYAGKDVYCEKPVSTTSSAGLELARMAEKAGVHNGAVQDKLFLPGLVKLSDVLSAGHLGTVLSVQIEFGYWVFEDERGATQRPSWNYRAEDGGGIVLDMFCHFRYLLDHLFGGVRSVMCATRTLVPRRLDEQGRRYKVTAEDSAYAFAELAGGAIAGSARRGVFARTATTSWSFTWTAQGAVPWQGCGTAECSRQSARPSLYGTLTSPRRSTQKGAGSKSRTTSHGQTPFVTSGNCSYGM